MQKPTLLAMMMLVLSAPSVAAGATDNWINWIGKAECNAKLSDSAEIEAAAEDILRELKTFRQAAEDFANFIQNTENKSIDRERAVPNFQEIQIHILLLNQRLLALRLFQQRCVVSAQK